MMYLIRTKTLTDRAIVVYGVIYPQDGDLKETICFSHARWVAMTKFKQ